MGVVLLLCGMEELEEGTLAAPAEPGPPRPSQKIDVTSLSTDPDRLPIISNLALL
jgi:hypothetical protein